MTLHVDVLLTHVRAVGAAAGCLWLCYAAGRPLLNTLGVALPAQSERAPFAVAVGAGVLALATLGLAFAGLLRPLPLALLFGALGLWSLRQVRTVAEEVARGVRELRQSRGTTVLVAGPLLLVALFLFSQALLPPTDWDSLMYHLEVPRQLLEEGRLFVPPDSLHVAYVGLVHMLYVGLLAFGGPAAPAVFSAGIALLLCLAVLSFGRRFFPDPSGRLGALLLWATTSVLLVAITPRIDVTVALYVFLVHYALLAALSNEERELPWLAAAGLLAGCAVGAKLHALPYLMALAPLGLWILWRGRPRTAGGRARMLTPLLLAALFLAPWLLKNWLLLEAPVYPFLAERALQPWLAAITGGSAPAVDPSVFGTLSSIREPFDPWKLFVSPGPLTVEGEGAYYFMNPLFLLLPLGLLVMGRGVLPWLLLPAVGYIAFITVPFSTTNLRYLLPAVPALTVVAAECLRRVSLHVRPRLARGLVVGAVLLALAPSLGTMALWTVRRAPLPYLTGTVDAPEYLVRTGEGLSRSFLDVIRFVNDELPTGSRTLLVLEARGYYFHREVLQDNVLTNWPLLAATGAPEDCLAGTGISHLLVNTAAANYYASRGADFDVLRWPELQRFAARCLEPVHEVPGYTLLRVRAAAEAGRRDPRGAPGRRPGGEPRDRRLRHETALTGLPGPVRMRIDSPLPVAICRGCSHTARSSCCTGATKIVALP